MKTAIQELKYLLTEVEQPENISKEELLRWVNLYGIGKEKEQIMYSYTNGSQDMAFEVKYEPLEYYNQTYNQNK